MSMMSPILDRLSRVSLEGSGSLRPRYPAVALEVNSLEIVLVRVRHRRGRPTVETIEARPLPEQGPVSTVARPHLAKPQEVAARVREAFEASGSRPGKVSLILPDNLAKLTLMSLPERPASRKQLQEIIRFKLRKTVPFRLEDAAISYQFLGGNDKEPTVLVAVMLRSVVEQYERVLQEIGARPGLVALCTPSLFNLYRSEMARAAGADGDVALLNCAHSYFSLLILRGEQLIFYRCKSFAPADQDGSPAPNGSLSRELATSLSYYQEKLEGRGIRAAYLRSVALPVSEVAEMLNRLGLERIEAIDPSVLLGIPERLHVDRALGQRIAPAIGAAAGGRLG